MSRAINSVSLCLAAVIAGYSWAATVDGAAHSNFVVRPGTPRPTQIQTRAIPRAVRFRIVRERGLLLTAWLNGSGPYTLAVDTGAGDTLLSADVVRRAALTTSAVTPLRIGGLSGATVTLDRKVFIDHLALGDEANILPLGSDAFVIPALPAGIDGILDPTTAFASLGYVVDLPNRELSAFDPVSLRLDPNDEPPGGTVVRWLREKNSKRPFVRLGDGRQALLDTGSTFGLATPEPAGVKRTNRKAGLVRDLGDGTVHSRRVGPTTVTVGSLVLQNVPTDVLSGIAGDVPVILGRDALNPFRITFDPVNRLIEIKPETKRK